MEVSVWLAGILRLSGALALSGRLAWNTPPWCRRRLTLDRASNFYYCKGLDLALEGGWIWRWKAAGSGRAVSTITLVSGR